MDIPYGIAEYSKDAFCTYLSYQTNTPFSYVSNKKQIIYIDNYLEEIVTNNEKIVIIYENEYIDRHYLEDYSTYYATCFDNYKKTNYRVHFFKTNKNDKNISYIEEFKKTLNNKSSSFITQNNYLGFIVVRPIPETFLAKVCLKRDIQENEILIKKSYNISLFGIDLFVKTIAFQEQDKILAACATSSLWTFYSAMLNTPPSPSSITKSAYTIKNGSGRKFPNTGLSTEMICTSLEHYGFVSEYFQFDKHSDSISSLKELIYAYISNNTPLILGISVLDKDNKSIGMHAVTIIGFLHNKTKNNDFIAHDIEAIFIHDDSYGLFLKLEFFKDEYNSEATYLCNTKLNIKYEPATLIIGLYHKIRIPYLSIKNSCIHFKEKITNFLQYENDTKEAAEIFNSLNWDICLKQNSDIKKEITKNKEIEKKEEYLTKSCPKFIWSAKASYDNIPLFEMLFDATDINQGGLFLCFLPTNIEVYDDILNLFKMFCSEFESGTMDEGNHADRYIWNIIKYFNKEDAKENTLIGLYGYLKIPKYIKKEEIPHKSISHKYEIKLNKENDKDIFILNKNLKKEEGYSYIWLIDKDGFLLIGKESKEDSTGGHPTLVKGMPARIGGELAYNNEKELWEINYESGRYSSDYSKEESKKYTENAIKYKFRTYFPNEDFTLKIKKRNIPSFNVDS